MLEKLISMFFVKTERKNRAATLSGSAENPKVKSVGQKTPALYLRSEEFWDGRGKAFVAIFSSLNGREF